MKSNFISSEKLKGVISCMNYVNALAIRTCLATGLRLNDVVSLKVAPLQRAEKVTIKEQKTGKSRRIYIPVQLRRELIRNSYVLSNYQSLYCFPHKKRKAFDHRTRQSVYVDFKRACDRFGLDPTGISPHSVRKLWAVQELDKCHSISAVQKKMNHRHVGVTALYALSDKISPEVKKNPAPSATKEEGPPQAGQPRAPARGEAHRRAGATPEKP